MDQDRKFNAIIIEDSASDEISLNKALKKYPNVTICGAYNNGHDGLEAIRRIRPSLVFLDMELPDMRGLDIIECLDAETLSSCRFIMHTSYADCMLESFRNHAFDFLLKPVQPDDLEKVMQRLQEAPSTEMPKAEGKIHKAEENLLMFLNSTDFQLVRLRDIGIFQYNSLHRLWEAVIANNKKPVRLKRNVNNKMLLTLGDQFVQVNQKYIVNINYLFQVTDNLCEFYPPFEDIDYVRVGSSFRRQLMERFLCL